MQWKRKTWQQSGVTNGRGEPVFSVMAAGRFCEKSGWIGKVEDVKPVLLKKRNGFQLATILRRRIFTWRIILWSRQLSSSLSSRTEYDLVLGFRLYIRWRLVAVWWMTNKRSFCFIIAFHNCATLKNQLTYGCPNSWPVVITMKKKLADTWKNI